MSDETETNEVQAQPRHTVRNCVIVLAGIATAVALAFFIIRPYARLERIAHRAISHHAPPGTTVGDIRVGFPLRITLSDLVVPVKVNGRQREIGVDKLAGRIFILPLLLGKMKVFLNADIFGGRLWLDLSGESASKGSLTVDARTRRMDIGQVCDFWGTRWQLSGKCDADVETTLDPSHFATLKGNAAAMGRDIRIPRIDLDKVVLPENSNAECTIGLSAKGGEIYIQKFEVTGTAYDISGTGTVHISEPFESSPLDGSFSAVFRKPPIITDRRVAGLNTTYLMSAITESKAKVFFEVSGTVGQPKTILNPSASIGSILKSSKR